MRCSAGAPPADITNAFDGQSMDEITEATDLAEADRRSRWTGVFIGVLAVLLAICSMGGDNAAKDANRANIDATNTWAFFQAKNIRRQMINLRIDEMELELAAEPAVGGGSARRRRRNWRSTGADAKP